MTQQRLGGKHHQGLSEGKTDLSAEEVEVVGGGGAVGHDVVDVDQLLDGELVRQLGEVLGVVAGHLKEPLGPGAAVLGAHALHAVGQQHHQSTLSHPLGLS